MQTHITSYMKVNKLLAYLILCIYVQDSRFIICTICGTLADTHMERNTFKLEEILSHYVCIHYRHYGQLWYTTVVYLHSEGARCWHTGSWPHGALPAHHSTKLKELHNNWIHA